MANKSGSGSYIAIQVEKAYGQAPTVPKSIILSNATYSDTFGAEQASIISQRISKFRGTSNIRKGLVTVSGGCGGELTTQMAAIWFYLALGSFTQKDVVVNTVNKKKITFKRKQEDVPSFQVAKYFDGDYIRLNGYKVNTMTIQSTPGEIISFSIDCIGQSFTLLDDPYDPAPIQISDNSYTGIDNGVTEDGQDAVYTDFSLNYSNGIAVKNKLGSKFIHSASVGTSTLSGSTTKLFEDMTAIQKWEQDDVKSIVVSNFVLGDDSIKLTIPKVSFSGQGLPLLNTPEGLELPMDWNAELNFVGNEANDIIIEMITDFDLTAYLAP